MIDYIKARPSIRKYTPEPISEEDVRTLLEAAMAAPSAATPSHGSLSSFVTIG